MMYRTFKNLVAGAILCTLAAAMTPASAILYGTTGFGGRISTLVEVDPTTGQIINTIGSVGFALNGLAVDHTTGTLYGSARLFGGLVRINTSTGAGTLIGTGWNTNVVNLSVNSAGQMYGWNELSYDLVSINIATGVDTVVGNAGIFTASHGLAFDSSDVLHLFNGATYTHYTVDLGTGEVTSVGSILGKTAARGDIDLSTGLYYGFSSGNECTGPCDGSMLVLDPTTNAVVSIFDSDGLHLLAFTVPEPGSLALFGLGLAGLGVMRRRRMAA